MRRNEPQANPLWLLERGGLRAEAEIVECPIGLWLRVLENGAIAFGVIRPSAQHASLLAIAADWRQEFERRGFAARSVQ